MLNTKPTQKQKNLLLLYRFFEFLNLIILFVVFKIYVTSVVDLFLNPITISSAFLSLSFVYIFLLEGSSNFLEELHFIVLYPFLKIFGVLRKDINEFHALKRSASYVISVEDALRVRKAAYSVWGAFVIFSGIQALTVGDNIYATVLLELPVIAVFIVESLIGFLELNGSKRLVYVFMVFIAILFNYLVGMNFVGTSLWQVVLNSAPVILYVSVSNYLRRKS